MTVSNKVVTNIFNICKENAHVDIKDKFILITKDTKTVPRDASKEWFEHFVFYSPSIVYGVDYNVEKKQDVFVYIVGRTLPPPMIFQQATRCRNIQNLYYFYDHSPEKSQCKYSTLDYCSNYFSDIINKNNKINIMCTIEEDGEIKLVKNSFFNLYVKNEYMIDCYRSCKIFFFEKILIENKFDIINYVEEQQTKDINVNLDVPKINKSKVLYEEYIDAKDKSLVKFEDVNKRIQLLNIPRKMIETYKDIIFDDKKLDQHFSIISFLQSDEYINEKFKYEKDEMFDIKLISSRINKLLLIRKLMNLYKIDYFDLSTVKVKDRYEEVINFNKKNWNFYRKVFRITKFKDGPKTMYELVLVLVGMIKHITCTNIFVSKIIMINTIRYYTYYLNKEVINYHMNVHILINPLLKHYHQLIYNIFNFKELENNNFVGEL